MDLPDLTASNFMEDTIDLKRVKLVQLNKTSWQRMLPWATKVNWYRSILNKIVDGWGGGDNYKTHPDMTEI